MSQRGFSDAFWAAIKTMPASLLELPWMLVELTGETGKTWRFAMAIHSGWIVGGAPIAKMNFGQRVKPVWRLMEHRKAVLERLDPPHDEERQRLLLTTYATPLAEQGAE